MSNTRRTLLQLLHDGLESSQRQATMLEMVENYTSYSGSVEKHLQNVQYWKDLAADFQRQIDEIPTIIYSLEMMHLGAGDDYRFYQSLVAVKGEDKIEEESGFVPLEEPVLQIEQVINSPLLIEGTCNVQE